MPSVSGQQWCDFNDARRTVEVAKDGESWKLSGPRAIEGLTVLWPERVASVMVDGNARTLNKVNWGGVGARSLVLDVRPDKTVSMAV